jgi:hypothetical protein
MRKNRKSMKIRELILLSILIAPFEAMSCGQPDLFQFGGFTTKLNKENMMWEDSLGESASLEKGSIVIDLAFLENLSNEISGEELQKNREEFIYLISIGHKKATLLGLKVLNHLLENPKYQTECETKFELYNKAELAFNLSRASYIYDALCEIEPEVRTTIITYYKNNYKLWATGYDAPWQEGNLSCN